MKLETQQRIQVSFCGGFWRVNNALFAAVFLWDALRLTLRLSNKYKSLLRVSIAGIHGSFGRYVCLFCFGRLTMEAETQQRIQINLAGFLGEFCLGLFCGCIAEILCRRLGVLYFIREYCGI